MARTPKSAALVCGILLILIFVSSPPAIQAQAPKPNWSDAEKPLLEKLRSLRGLPDDKRKNVTKQIAVEIRQLPAGLNKVRLAEALANLSTEGDFGHDTLEEVGATLGQALLEIHCRMSKVNQPDPMLSSRN